MNTRTLGRTGFAVTEIGFGAWPIGSVSYGDVPRTEASACIEAYLERGGNFIDTARVYGASEMVLGETLARLGARERVVLASKSIGHGEDEIRADLEESLEQLQTDRIDLYYLHSPPEDPGEMNRTLDVFERFRDEGKIRAIGASIKGPDVTEATQALCRQYIATGRVDALQVIFSIFRQMNAAVIREAAEAGVGIVGRTVLESGFLTGKYKPGDEFEGRDHRTRWGGKRLEGILACVDELTEQAIEPPYEHLSQVALRFALDQPGLSSVIPGARTVQQVTQNMAVADMPPLSDALRNRLVSMYGDRTPAFNTGR